MLKQVRASSSVGDTAEKKKRRERRGLWADARDIQKQINRHRKIQIDKLINTYNTAFTESRLAFIVFSAGPRVPCQKFRSQTSTTVCRETERTVSLMRLKYYHAIQPEQNVLHSNKLGVNRGCFFKQDHHIHPLISGRVFLGPIDNFIPPFSSTDFLGTARTVLRIS